MSRRWRLREYESLPSTSDLCATLAQAGEPEGLAVLAGRQTAARGSRGRRWQTLPGNLALSVLLRPGGSPSAAGHWALLAAVALAEALEASGAPPVRLKWPNDVMLDGKKLGGILLDSGIEAGRLGWLVIGFGANLAAAPDLPTAAKLPTPISPRAVALAVADRLDHWASRVNEPGLQSPLPSGEGWVRAGHPAETLTPALSRRERETDVAFALIHRAWLDRGPAIGTPLRLTFGTQEIAGTFVGLNDTGALLLQSGHRTQAFSTGDVLQGA